MRILWFAPDPPFLREYGGGIDIACRIKHARAAGDRIALVSFVRREPTAEERRVVERGCATFLPVRRRAWRAALRYPWLPFAVASRMIDERRLAALAAETRPDVAVFESPIVASCLHQLQRLGIPVVMRVHNLEAAYARANAAASASATARIAHRAEALRMRSFERSCYASSDALVPLSLVEARALGRRRSVPVVHVPIPVAIRNDSPRPILAPYVCFTGSMYLPVNAEAVRWFLRDVWPRVRASGCPARFVVVGRGPPPDLVQAASEASGIVVTGEVEDAQAFIAGADVVVVPMLNGAGVKVKAIEALGHGAAIVATPAAVSGTTIRDGRESVVRSDAAAFADAVIDMLARPEAYRAMRERALQCFRAHHEPEVVGQRFRAVLADVASRWRGRR